MLRVAYWALSGACGLSAVALLGLIGGVSFADEAGRLLSDNGALQSCGIALGVTLLAWFAAQAVGRELARRRRRWRPR
jgi:hypothetical protein